MDSEPGGRWISYTELAKIRGTDKTSALKLALRKKWPRRKDNHGTMHVCVPLEWLGSWGNRTPHDMPSSMPNGMDISRAVNTLEIALAAANKRADQAEKRADRAEIRAEQAETRENQAQQIIEMERNRADRAEAGREAAQIRVDRAEQAADVLRDRLDATQAELQQAHAATDQARAQAHEAEDAAAVLRRARSCAAGQGALGPAQGGMAWRMMIGVANRYQRNRREPTSAGRTDQCLACFPVQAQPARQSGTSTR